MSTDPTSGQVLLEQIAHNPGLGWYTQRSFDVPADLLLAVTRALHKARCLQPADQRADDLPAETILRFPSHRPG